LALHAAEARGATNEGSVQAAKGLFRRELLHAHHDIRKLFIELSHWSPPPQHTHTHGLVNELCMCCNAPSWRRAHTHPHTPTPTPTPTPMPTPTPTPTPTHTHTHTHARARTHARRHTASGDRGRKTTQSMRRQGTYDVVELIKLRVSLLKEPPPLVVGNLHAFARTAVCVSTVPARCVMLTSGERADLEVVNGIVDRNCHAELHLQVLRPFGPASPRRRPVSRARVRVGRVTAQRRCVYGSTST